MIDYTKYFIPNIHEDGYLFISISLLITLLIFKRYRYLGYIGIVLSVWCVFFFRDPERITLLEDGIVVSPADGKIQRIETLMFPGKIATVPMNRISIFLDIFDVHVNRIPVSGAVKALNYQRGKFFNAALDKASEYNERQVTLLILENKEEVGIIQLAGFIARRIICDLKEGQKVTIGDKFGIIRFGSRVDLYLPIIFDIQVIEAQTMVGGETIVATFKKIEH